MLKQTSPTLPVQKDEARRALVVFTHATDQAWLRRVLPRGFRHCAIYVEDGTRWIALEALAGYTEIVSVARGKNMPKSLRDSGFTVVETVLRRDDKARRMQIPAFYSCVESVKRVLGLRKPLVLTPSQLYRVLMKAGRA